MARKPPPPGKGAPLGNQYGKTHRLFQEGIKRALARANGTVDRGLDKVCDKIVKAAMDGDRLAAEMIAERIEGRPIQTVDATVHHDVVSLENADNLTQTLEQSMAKRTEPPDPAVH